MDLKVEDLAELLNISEKTVHRWLSENKIPFYRHHQEYRFSRPEIEDWLLKEKLDYAAPLQPGKGSLQFSLYRALFRGDVLDHIEGETKEVLIQNAMNHMGKKFDLDPAVLTELLLDRENRMATALNEGIGIPHTRDFLLDTHFDVVLVLYPKKPIEYGALDGKPVHTLFFLFANEDNNHLHLLAKIAHLSSQEANRNFLQGRPSKELLLEKIKQWEAFLQI